MFWDWDGVGFRVPGLGLGQKFQGFGLKQEQTRTAALCRLRSLGDSDLPPATSRGAAKGRSGSCPSSRPPWKTWPIRRTTSMGSMESCTPATLVHFVFVGLLLLRPPTCPIGLSRRSSSHLALGLSLQVSLSRSLSLSLSPSLYLAL